MRIRFLYETQRHSNCTVHAHEAITRAAQFARGCGETDLTDLVATEEGPQRSSASSSQDITSSLLVKPKHFGPSRPASATSLQKAAILSFQTWCNRAPGLVGLLLGSKSAKRTNASCLVVAQSFEELISSPEVQAVCTNESVFPCGVVLEGEECCGDERPAARAWLSHLAESQGLESALCVLVTWLLFKRFELTFPSYIYINVFVYAYIYICLIGSFVVSTG